MSKISKNDVEHVSELSRIKLENTELETYTRELESILEYITELEKVSNDGIESIEQISNLENVARLDEIIPSLSVEEVLQNVPEKEGNFIRVKKVFE